MSELGTAALLKSVSDDSFTSTVRGVPEPESPAKLLPHSLTLRYCETMSPFSFLFKVAKFALQQQISDENQRKIAELTLYS